MTPVDSPCDSNLSMSVNPFEGFTYVAPSVLEDIQRPPTLVKARSPRKNCHLWVLGKLIQPRSFCLSFKSMVDGKMRGLLDEGDGDMCNDCMHLIYLLFISLGCFLDRKLKWVYKYVDCRDWHLGGGGGGGGYIQMAKILVRAEVTVGYQKAVHKRWLSFESLIHRWNFKRLQCRLLICKLCLRNNRCSGINWSG